VAKGKFVAYFRVSTAKQGASGLGLQAQSNAVHAFLNGGDWQLVAEFTEVESGKRNDRPELAKAVAACRLYGAKLIIAKLDRLSRDVHFLTGLEKAGVQFVAADMPEANEMVVHMMAVVAQAERKMIGARTKAALAAAKDRGTTLGGFKGYRPSSEDRAKALETRQSKVAARGALMAPLVDELRAAGTTSLSGIASALNERGITTARGSQWHPTSVARLLEQMDASPKQ